MKDVSVETFHEMVENENGLNILDVRPQELYEKGHVPGAVHFPLPQIEDRLDELDKDKTYYTICQTGVSSKKAANILDRHGFAVTNVEKGVSNYPGKLAK